ncbi:MAG TPA: hypothetical protein VN883_12620 [Myxococcales bacterium]|nr:hypothetical protein [Myxococcales bacterium]
MRERQGSAVRGAPPRRWPAPFFLALALSGTFAVCGVKAPPRPPLDEGTAAPHPPADAGVAPQSPDAGAAPAAPDAGAGPAAPDAGAADGGRR